MDFEERMNSGKLMCSLCGNKIEEAYNLYKDGENPDEDEIRGVRFLHRGLSKDMFLCDECSELKLTLKNPHYGNKNDAEKKATKLVENKVDEIKEVIEKWKKQEDYNIFDCGEDLKYYVEGVDSYLFVYRKGVLCLKDYLTVNGSICRNLQYHACIVEPEFSNDMKWYFDDLLLICQSSNLIKTSLLDFRENDKENKVNRSLSAFIGGYCKDYDPIVTNINSSNPDIVLTDVKEVFIEQLELMEENEKNIDIYLKKSIGNLNGKLTINEDFKMDLNTNEVWNAEKFHNLSLFFYFAYHQNALMEEIYNYILKRQAIMTSPDYDPENDIDEEEDEEIVSVEENISIDSSDIMKNASVDTNVVVNKKDGSSDKKQNVSDISIADEIVKLKNLLNVGVLSQEEFDDAKKKLLEKY